MKEILELTINFICTLFKLLKAGGTKAVIAENLALKHQLIILNRRNKRAPKLNTSDRLLFGLIPFLVTKQRIKRISVILKPGTILRFHKALVQRKYSKLFSNKSKRKTGRKGPDQALIDLVIKIKGHNPRIGYGRIAMQLYHEFGIKISRFAVGRILRKHYDKNNPSQGNGPSWLSFIEHMKDSLW